MPNTPSPFQPKPSKRSPFPNPSLPQAGESSYTALFDLFCDKFLYYLLLTVTFCGITLTLWLERWLGRVSPWVWTGVTAAFGVYTTYPGSGSARS